MKQKICKVLFVLGLVLVLLFASLNTVKSDENIDTTKQIHEEENTKEKEEELNETEEEKDVVESEVKEDIKTEVSTNTKETSTKKKETTTSSNTSKDSVNKVQTKPTEDKKNESKDIAESTETKEQISNKVSLGTFKLTAYCDCSKCNGKWTGMPTASGVMPKSNHTIAVDTSVIPFGTTVVINGNTYVAEDTGSAIKGNKIDIYHDSHQAALNFGVQYAEVFIYK